MKLVSTSSHECERHEGVPRSKKPMRDATDHNRTPDFSLSMQTLNSSLRIAHELDAITATNLENETEIDAVAPNIEELAAAPANDVTLARGFELFGSVFSPLRMNEPLSRNDEGQRRTDLKSGEESHPGFVLIDFNEARKRVQTFAEAERTENDPISSVVRDSEINRTSELFFEARPKVSEMPSYDVSSTNDVIAKRNSRQMEIVGSAVDRADIIDPRHAELISDLQSSNSTSSRVDQIVRAVVQQSAELSQTNSVTIERQTHAGLTGQTLRLSLHPTELGCVQVSVSKRGKRLQVTIVPELESTGRLLVKDAEQLVKRLGLTTAGSDYVQIQISAQDSAVEAHGSEEHTQFSARSENGRERHDGQQSASHTLKADQRERDRSDEKLTLARDSNSHDRPDGNVYI